MTPLSYIGGAWKWSTMSPLRPDFVTSIAGGEAKWRDGVSALHFLHFTQERAA